MRCHWRLKGGDGYEKIQVEDSLQAGRWWFRSLALASSCRLRGGAQILGVPQELFEEITSVFTGTVWVFKCVSSTQNGIHGSVIPARSE